MSDFKAQHARFVDAKGGLLEIHSKQMKDGSFQVVAYHVPKNGKRQRGCVSSLTGEEDAKARFAELCSDAEKMKWKRKVRQSKGASVFDSIPKAGS